MVKEQERADRLKKREAALRENLKRRKAAAQPKKTSGNGTEENGTDSTKT